MKKMKPSTSRAKKTAQVRRASPGIGFASSQALRNATEQLSDQRQPHKQRDCGGEHPGKILTPRNAEGQVADPTDDLSHQYKEDHHEICQRDATHHASGPERK